jgi:hypothetical protein
MRSRDHPVEIASATRAVQREAPVSASSSALPGRTLSFATLAVPAHRPGRMITLMPVAAGRSGAEPPTRKPRTTEPSRHLGSAKDTVQEFVGALAVESVPTGAGVFINQQHVGETPLHLTRLRAGSHVIRIEHEGYERWTTAALISADKQARVSAKLQAIRDHGKDCPASWSWWLSPCR